ncbi:MAG TPA: biotin/lipoyl-binding protein [Candidatus Aminicenantes bacterium]|nr:biotin/lipoyl-binding protein [Candidatus Aminicenantes bacterium]
MNEYVLSINQKEYRVELGEINADYALLQVNGREFRVDLKQLGLAKLMPVPAAAVEARPAAAAAAPAAGIAPAPAAAPVAVPGGEASSVVKAPLPGLIIDVKVREGEKVKAGQNIVVMEAMKMENQIQATADGTVKKIFVKKGDNVAEGNAMVEIARSDMASL